MENMQTTLSKMKNYVGQLKKHMSPDKVDQAIKNMQKMLKSNAKIVTTLLIIFSSGTEYSCNGGSSPAKPVEYYYVQVTEEGNIFQ